MNFTFFNKARRVLLIPLMLLFSVVLRAQCDVFIEQGSVVVTDNGSGVKFQFDVLTLQTIRVVNGKGTYLRCIGHLIQVHQYGP
jgi:hypothetical protein